METFDHINSCNDLVKGFIRNVAEERDRAPVLALLQRLEKISAPNAGAPKILLLFCAIARYSRWLPGQMYLELARNAERTVVDIQVDEGGIRERLGKKLTFAAPLDEFVNMVRRLNVHSDMPLKVMSYRKSGDVLTAIELTMAVAVRALTVPPPEMTERVQRATIGDSAGSRAPQKPRKPKGVTPSILHVVQPDLHAPVSAVPISQRADTREIDDEWG